VGIPTPTSVRFDKEVLDRLHAFVASHPGTSLSSASNRFVDEALRSQGHPQIIFRDGPSGRRARLVGGPDVGEVVAALRACRDAESDLEESEIVNVVAETAGLEVAQVRAVLAYWAEYPREIDEALRYARAESERVRLRWEREHGLLAK
jgi:hypothetical protein